MCSQNMSPEYDHRLLNIMRMLCVYKMLPLRPALAILGLLNLLIHMSPETIIVSSSHYLHEVMVVSQQEKKSAVDKIIEPDSSGQLQLIQLLQRHLLASPDIESVVRKIKELFPRYFGVDSVTILLYDPTHDVLLDKGYAGIFHANEKSLSNPQSTTLNIFKKSFREGVPIAIEDCLSSDLLPKQYCMDHSLQSLLAVPIVMKDRTFGVLSLGIYFVPASICQAGNFVLFWLLRNLLRLSLRISAS